MLLICGLSGEIHNGKWTGVYPTSVHDILKEENVNLFPNPSNDYLNVDFTMSETSDITITMNDITGKTVYTKSLNNLNGNQGLVINTASLNNGVYTLRLQTKEGAITRKVSISH